MTRLCELLTTHYGENLGYWRLHLLEANIRPELSLGDLHPKERRALARLLEQREPNRSTAPSTPSTTHSALEALTLGVWPQLSTPEALIAWARQRVLAYLHLWEPARLEGLWFEPADEPHTTPLPSPSLAQHLPPERWQNLDESTQRFALFLSALPLSPPLRHLTRSLCPIQPGEGLPWRLLQRLVWAGGPPHPPHSTLPRDLLGVYRAEKLDWIYLLPPPEEEQSTPPTMMRLRRGELALEGQGDAGESELNPAQLQALMSSPPVELALSPEAFAPRTQTGLVQLRERWQFRHEVAQRGHDLGAGGLVTLFSGEDDQGQLPAALWLCEQLQLKLRRINAGQLVSRFIGESSQRVSLLLDLIEANPHTALYLEGADTLFGSRQSLDGGGDLEGGTSASLTRESNRTVNTLLARLDHFSGLLILRGQSLSELDSALQRRISVTVQFQSPEQALRLQRAKELWRVLSPKVGLSPSDDAYVPKALAAYPTPLEELSRRAADLAFMLACKLLHPDDMDHWLAQRARSL